MTTLIPIEQAMPLLQMIAECSDWCRGDASGAADLSAMASGRGAVMQMINLALTPAEADCLVMMLSEFRDHECAEMGELAAKFTQSLVKAGARPFPPAK